MFGRWAILEKYKFYFTFNVLDYFSLSKIWSENIKIRYW